MPAVDRPGGRTELPAIEFRQAHGPPASRRREVRRRRPSRFGPPLDLGPAVLAVLGTWLASRAAVLLVSLLGAHTVRVSSAGDAPPLSPSGLRTVWDHWDVGLFVKVARFGYLSPAYPDRTEVDLPGMPLAMRIVHPLVGDWVGAGLVVSLLAGLVASAALWRLAADDAAQEVAGPGTRGPTGTAAPVDAAAERGRRAVLLLVCFPYAVFLFAGYSEALFLAFATTAWLAVRRERWVLAGVLCAGATATRVLGLALLAAVWLEYGRHRWRTSAARSDPASRRLPRPRRWRRLEEIGGLLLPVLPPAAFAAYFQVRTGHWDAYTRAMREHWGRRLAPPWEGLVTTWHQAANAGQPASFQVFWWAEIVAVVVGVVLVVVLATHRRFGEAAYVAGCTVIMSCSTYWASGVRAVLVWFPLYLVLARRPRVLVPYLWVCAPVSVVFVLAFTGGVWVD